MNIVIKQAADFDNDELQRLEKDIWGEEIGSSDTIVKAPISIFPAGYFVAEVNGQLAGSLATMILDWDPHHPPQTWEQVTSGGQLTNHQTEGNALYGVQLGVVNQFQGMNVRKLLLQRGKELTIHLELDLLFFGARLPSYHKYSGIDVLEYIERRDDQGRRIETELQLFEESGFVIDTVLPEYMSGKYADPESCNFGVLTYWLNPKRQKE